MPLPPGDTILAVFGAILQFYFFRGYFFPLISNRELPRCPRRALRGPRAAAAPPGRRKCRWMTARPGTADTLNDGESSRPRALRERAPRGLPLSRAPGKGLGRRRLSQIGPAERVAESGRRRDGAGGRDRALSRRALPAGPGCPGGVRPGAPHVERTSCGHMCGPPAAAPAAAPARPRGSRALAGPARSRSPRPS